MVFEAGLGGSRDATNVLSSSNVAASVITTVGSEHLAALGGSLESIAEAKSGIIKEGRPVKYMCYYEWSIFVCLLVLWNMGASHSLLQQGSQKILESNTVSYTVQVPLYTCSFKFVSSFLFVS